jgi:hypothetical protein
MPPDKALMPAGQVSAYLLMNFRLIYELPISMHDYIAILLLFFKASYLC